MNATDNSSQLRDLQEENELLISQLHLVQEELERYYLKNKELEAASSSRAAPSGSSSVQLNAWVDDELPAALAESARLQSLLNLQQQVRTLEANNSLSARLATELAAASTSRGKLIRVPQKLMSFWNKENNKTAPASLGGKGHPKLLTAYAEKGMPAANKLLEDDSLSATQKANAWTDLARHLKDSNPQAAAQAARHAYEVDPRAFRLKWLAFRMHKAGDAQQAEAALELLPADIKLSASEQQSADKVRQKARKEREQQAKNSCNFNARRAETEKQLQQLTRERNAQQSQVQKLEAEIRNLKARQSQLTEKSEQDKRELARSQTQITQIRSELHKAHGELEALSAGRTRLNASKAELEQTLSQRDAELARVRNDLDTVHNELETLAAVRAQLTEDKTELEQALSQRDAELARVRNGLDTAHNELETLAAVRAQLTEDKTELEQVLSHRDETIAQAYSDLEAARSEIESMAASEVQLAASRSELEKNLTQRDEKIKKLEGALSAQKEQEKELEYRQQLMQEEMIRAESQLDIIKSLLVKGALE